MSTIKVPEDGRRREVASGLRVCYSCDRLLAAAQLYGRKSRECRSCRARRAHARTDQQRFEDLLSVARARATKRGLPFDLTVTDLEIPKRCPVLDIELRWGSWRQRDHSPSLDRLIPERGYVKGNVLVVSWLANNIRGSFTPEQLRRVANFYEPVIAATRRA